MKLCPDVPSAGTECSRCKCTLGLRCQHRNNLQYAVLLATLNVWSGNNTSVRDKQRQARPASHEHMFHCMRCTSSTYTVGDAVLIAAGDFYNSSDSSEITPYVGTPYGFHPRAMSGFTLGFPVIFDNRLSYNDSQRVLTILSDGNYLDGDTAALTVRLLTFNAELQVYGYACLCTVPAV